MNTVSTVMGHEILKLLKDRKTLFSMIFLPLVSGFMVYLVSNIGIDKDSKNACLYLCGGVECYEEVLSSDEDYVIKLVSTDKSSEEVIEGEDYGKSDVCFDLKAMKLYYNSTDETSLALKKVALDLVDESYAMNFSQEEGLKYSEPLITDTADSESSGTLLLSLFLPYMLILILFTNITTFTGDSIAGEKERGVFEKTLLAPVDSGEIILGKTLSGIFIGILSTVIYGFVIIAFSKWGEENSILRSVEISASETGLIVIYGVLIAYLFSAILVLCSLFAKTVKEARNLALPVMVVSLLLSLMSMFRSGVVGVIYYLVPVYNVCLIFQDILNGRAEASKMLATCGVLLACSLFVLFLSKKIFTSDKIRC